MLTATSEDGGISVRPKLTITYIESELLTFQEGVAGYVGTHDTWFGSRAHEYGPYGTEITMKTAKWSSSRQEAMVRFGNIYGENTNQVSYRDTILAAELIMTVPYEVYGDGDPNNVHKMLVDWDESTAAYNWSGFGGNGVQTNNIEASIRIYDDSSRYTNSVGVIPTGTMMTLNVTDIVKDWSNGDGNYGFLFDSPATAGGDGLSMASSEYISVEEYRPKLMIHLVRISQNGTCIIIQ